MKTPAPQAPLSRRPVARDMDRTPFTPALDELLSRVPGAYAAALVDGEGECVDYTGTGAPFDIKIAAAELRILISQLETEGNLGALRWFILRGAKRSVVARGLTDNYALVALLHRRAGFTASRRAFDACERALSVEAGWPYPEKGWHPIEVAADRRGRPRTISSVATEAQPVDSTRVEILGTLASSIGARERGYRVRTARGNELTLVREAGRVWYADEPVHVALAASDELEASPE